MPNLGNAPLMMQFDAKSAYYYIALGMLALGLVITYAIEQSWMGYYLVAVGEDEDAAEAIGVNAMRIKRQIYMISAFLTGMAGTFYVQYIYFIDPQTAFSFNISVEAALVSIVGGIGTLWGSRCWHRLARSDLRAAAKLVRQQPWRRAADGLQPHSDRRDSLPAGRTDRAGDRHLCARRPIRFAARKRSAARWLKRWSSATSAGGSADCAPCRM